MKNLSGIIAAYAITLLLLISCSQKGKEKDQVNFNSGECYLLPDSLGFGHGLILFSADTSLPNHWLLCPVMLDSASVGIEQFLNGNLQLQGYLDFNVSGTQIYAPAGLQPQNNQTLKECLQSFSLIGR